MIIPGIVAVSGAGSACVDPADHRYWRILVVSNSGDGSYVGAAEILMREESGGGWDVVPLATLSANQEDPGNEVENVHDGSDITFWRTDGAAINGSWFKLDFGVGNTGRITQIGITARNVTTFYDQTIKDFVLEYSDNDVDWTSAFVVSGESNYTQGESRTFTACYDTPLAEAKVAYASVNVPLNRISDGLTVKKGNVNVVLGNHSDRLAIRHASVNVVVEP